MNKKKTDRPPTGLGKEAKWQRAEGERLYSSDFLEITKIYKYTHEASNRPGGQMAERRGWDIFP